MKYETPIQTLINIARDDDYPTGLCEQAEAELVQKDEALAAARGLIAYRDRVGPLNFQLEKADDFINGIRNALAKATP